MQVFATSQRVQLPARQRVMRLWLDQLCRICPGWDRAELERLSLQALADFYRYMDDGDVEPHFDLKAFVDANIAPAHLSLIDIARIFIVLRSVVRQAMVDQEAALCLMVMDHLDKWTDRVVSHYADFRQLQILERKVEIAQRMAELNMLNYCAATLNATLDSVSVLNATARLACTLTNADLAIVFQREGDYLYPNAIAGTLAYQQEMIEITDPDLLETLIVDDQQQDLPIEQVRLNLEIAAAQAMCCTPLRAGNEIIGKLTLIYATPRRFTPQQRRLQEIFASHAGQAVHNAQLYEQLGELSVAQERQRIACEMHDTMLQTLVSLNINLQVALNHAGREHWDQVTELVEDARRLGKIAIAEGRETLNNLREECMACDTPSGVLEALDPELRLFAEQTTITPRLIVTGNSSPAVGKDVAHHLRRLVGEALTNVQRHARATDVVVRVDAKNGDLWLQVQDNGIGFVPAMVDQQQSFGLLGMQERARFIDAEFDINSTPGRGTTVIIRVPTATP